MLLNLLIPSLLALPAVIGCGCGPDELSILDTLAKITTDTIALNTTLAAFTGSDDGLTYILRNSTALQNDITTGASDASNAPPVVFQDALLLASATARLAQDTNSTIGTLINTKPQFDKLGASPIVLSTVQNLKAATANFSGVVIGKLPLDVAPVGEQLVDLINDQFARAIQVYSS